MRSFFASVMTSGSGSECRSEIVARCWPQLLEEHERCKDVQLGEKGVELTQLPQIVSEFLHAFVQSPLMHPDSADDEERNAAFIYLLENGVIARMCSMASIDDPAGFRDVLLTAIEALLSHVHPPLMANTDVHGPVLLLLRACVSEGVLQSSSHTRELLSVLMHSICVQLRRNPNLCPIFFSDGPIDHPPSQPSCSGTVDNTKSVSSSFEFLFDCLLQLHSEAGCAGDVSRNAMVVCASVDDEQLRNHLCCTSNLFAVLSSRVAALYAQLPKCPTTEEQDPIEHAEEFSVYLVFVDEICDELGIAAEPLCKRLRDEWLLSLLRPALLAHQESVVRNTTNYVRNLLLAQIKSAQLRETIVRFLLEDTTLREVLIHRIDDANDAIAYETLSLFCSLLSLRDQNVFVQLDLLSGSGKTTLQSDVLKSLFPRVNSLNVINDNFEEYLIAAVTQSELWMDSYLQWNTVDVTQGNKEETERLFLRKLNDKISLFSEQSFAVNLRLTGILSELALCPHPAVHSLVLDTTECDDKRRSYLPLLTLSQVWNDALPRIESMPDFQQRFNETRRLLDAKDDRTILEMRDCQLFMQSIIVLTECIQEISAISKNKLHLSHGSSDEQ